MSSEPRRDPTDPWTRKHGVMCPVCVAEGRAQRMEYALQMHRWSCTIHGPQITGETLNELAPKGSDQ